MTLAFIHAHVDIRYYDFIYDIHTSLIKDYKLISLNDMVQKGGCHLVTS